MMQIKRLAPMIVMLLLSGCITYSNHQLGEVDNWPMTPAAGKLNSITLRVTGQRQFQGSAQPTPPALVQAWEKSSVKYYKDSGFFSDVITGRSDADIYADVIVTSNEKGSLVLAFLSGLTLMVLPAVDHNIFTMKTTFRNAKGEVIGTVEKTESVTTWMEIVLIFGMPFSVSQDEIMGTIVKHTLIEAAEKGYLKKSA